jgi:2-C-methyl-D-erythritol 4-phosphate cytidylyltransferase
MPSYFAVVPAAGSGSRLGHETPKQYLMLQGRPLVEHAVSRLARSPRIERVLVVLAPGDTRFREFDWQVYSDKLVPLYCGGPTRAASVFNGLLAASDMADEGDWMLVHDAARPCLARADIERLIEEVGDDPTGGLLAVPVADTLKRADGAGRVAATEPREGLWQAQTPQMFRYELLLRALRTADPAAVTDEACAIEALGLKPRLVQGSLRNIKVTYPQDLALAAAILAGEEN